MDAVKSFNGNIELVRQRSHVDAVVRSTHFYFLLFSAVYFSALLFARLTGLMPDYFIPAMVLLPLFAAAAAGLLAARRLSRGDAARLADSKLKTDDLFYTVVLLDKAHGEYRPLVAGAAEAQADKIRPAEIVPWKWSRELRNAGIAAAVLLAGSLFIPQLDPFGRQLQRRKAEEAAKQLKKGDEDVRKMLESLKKSSGAKNSPEVARAIEEMKNEFKSLKSGMKEQNAMKLAEMQKQLNSLMKMKNEEKLQDMLNKGFSRQSFGKKSEKAESWKKQVEKKDFSGIKKELSEMRDMAKKLSEPGDSAEKQKAKEELQRRMKELMDFAKNELGSKSVQAALEKSMNDMDMAGMENMMKEAMQAASNSMELGQRELERLEQAMNDMQQLESAAKASQMAKMLNELQKLSEANQEGLEGIEDYEDFYRRSMGKGGEGEGGEKGTGKPGRPGKGGGKVDENELAKTDTKSELSKSQMQAGKILMEWRVKDASEHGVAKEEYLESVKEVKQGVSEAIVKEQVPPGYHDAIRNYFDTLGPGGKK